MKTRMIGFHLIVDGILDGRADDSRIHKILSELPSQIEMSILAGPFVVKGKPENPGWTGFVVIDKSHIAIHTFDEGDKICIDVFSCKPFDDKRVLQYLRENLKFSKYTVKKLNRSEE